MHRSWFSLIGVRTFIFSFSPWEKVRACPGPDPGMRGNLLITLTFVLSHQRLCQNVILRPFVWLRINSAEESAFS
jgi:hypothetical protein